MLTGWTGGLLLAMPAAGAVDLTVQSVTVSQAIQVGSTQLIGGKTACVRATIGIAGAGAPVPGVDAVLRVWVNGVAQSGVPVFSSNGPITAPLSPQLTQLNNTLNFLVLVPPSSDVDFRVEVNPAHQIAETNYANNSLSLNNQVFECRGVVELDYVPINYAPLGGPPAEALLEPGVGDAFVRAIYSPSEWNYHRAPLPPLLWTQDIAGSTVNLLNTLRDMRVNLIPSAGYPEPPFLFGWLPGNPYSGNGKSISIPGDVAFGNTDIGRYQRTFAHELGHLVGLSHNSAYLDTVGIDVEHHLGSLPSLFPTDKHDIMVPAMLTNQAFIDSASYNTFLGDPRTQCAAALAATGAPVATQPVLRLAGTLTTAAGPQRNLDFWPVTQLDRGVLTRNESAGDLLVSASDRAGVELWQLTSKTGTAAELCDAHAPDQGNVDPISPFHVLIPETVNSRVVDRITLIDRASGRVLGQRQRSPSAPIVAVTGVVALGDSGLIPGALQQIHPGKLPEDRRPLVGRVRVSWTGADPDGDPLSYTLRYSPDGGHAWLPLVVNTTATQFEFDASDVPASQGREGIISVSASDGMNHGEGNLGPMAIGAGSPPGVYLLTPNTGDVILQHASIVFHAAAWDLEDLMLDGSAIRWTSSINGPIGTGRQFINSTLSPGTHTITVTATDLDGMAASKQIALTILPRQIVNPDPNGDGHVNGLDLALLLGAWGSCPSGCPADLNVDGQVNGLDLALLLGAWG